MVTESDAETTLFCRYQQDKMLIQNQHFQQTKLSNRLKLSFFFGGGKHCIEFPLFKVGLKHLRWELIDLNLLWSTFNMHYNRICIVYLNQ